MGKGLSGTNIVNSSTVHKRNKKDFYSTPPNVTRALMNFLQLPKDTLIWEPACGEGMMALELQRLGYLVLSTDLHRHEQEFGSWGLDFTTAKSKPLMGKDKRPCEWVITNPPFSLAADFIRASANLHLDGFALLLKSQYWHAAGRLPLFQEHPPAYVLPLTWRPDFLHGARGGNPTMECLWTVWIKGKNKTLYYPLERPHD